MRRLAWIFVAVALASGAWVLMTSHVGEGYVCWFCSTQGHHHHPERPAWRKLLALHAAQEDFLGNDRNENGRKEYWRADVAGLYGLLPKGSSAMIKLIDVSMAGADLAPVGTAQLGDAGPGVVDRDLYAAASPCAGYWFVALRFEDEEGRPLDPKRFAAVAVPDTPGAGRRVYAVTHEGVVWEAPARGARDVPRAFPLDPAAAGWKRRMP